MIALVCFILAVLASPFKSKSRLEAENAVVCTENLRRAIKICHVRFSVLNSLIMPVNAIQIP